MTRTATSRPVPISAKAASIGCAGASILRRIRGSPPGAPGVLDELLLMTLSFAQGLGVWALGVRRDNPLGSLWPPVSLAKFFRNVARCCGVPSMPIRARFAPSGPADRARARRSLGISATGSRSSPSAPAAGVAELWCQAKRGSSARCAPAEDRCLRKTGSRKR